MASDNLRAILDGLGRATTEELLRLQRVGALLSSGPAVPPLTFHAGAAVIDLPTGRRGVVRVAARGESPSVELYRVELETGAIVYRTPAELAADVPPAVRP